MLRVRVNNIFYDFCLRRVLQGSLQDPQSGCWSQRGAISRGAAEQVGPALWAGVSRRRVKGRHMGRHIIQNRIGYLLLRRESVRKEG